MRTALYLMMIVCFLAAGLLDICEHRPKLGLISILLGITNAILFFWRVR